MAMTGDDQIIIPTEEQRAALGAVEQFLRADNDDCLGLTDCDGRTIALPPALQHLLRQATPLLAYGHALAVTSFGMIVTASEAAEILTEPIHIVLQLLEAGTIPATVTPHGWEIPLDGLLAYKARRDAERGAALAELTRYSEEIERATSVE
jgi:hypothetical protein